MARFEALRLGGSNEPEDYHGKSYLKVVLSINIVSVLYFDIDAIFNEKFVTTRLAYLRYRPLDHNNYKFIAIFITIGVLTKGKKIANFKQFNGDLFV